MTVSAPDLILRQAARWAAVVVAAAVPVVPEVADEVIFTPILAVTLFCQGP